jgi:hypothetical protein
MEATMNERMNDRLLTVVWLGLLAGVISILGIDSTRAAFKAATAAHPYGMGMLKVALLGTMGELLGGKIVTGRWRLVGIRLHQRVLLWALFGALFALVFPLFAAGVAGLLQNGLLPVWPEQALLAKLLPAFYTSFIMQIFFGFGFMVLHRVTDTLIDRGELFGPWPLAEILRGLDWRNLLRVPMFACIWFWTPAHTVTFLLPPEFRVMSAALLAIVLGFIVGLAKKMSQKRQAA